MEKQRDRVALLIKQHNVDIVGLQETYGQIRFLKKRTCLKNNYGGEGRGENLSVLSRFKINNGFRNIGVGGEVIISSHRKLLFFSTWFTSVRSTEFRKKNLSDQQLVDLDNRYRLPALKKMLEGIKRKYKRIHGKIPTIIAGDHNAGSHLDFNSKTVGLPQNYGRGEINFPLSMLLEKKGYIDSFRQVHPSVIEKPGHTYSAIYHSSKKEFPIAFLDNSEKNKYSNTQPHFRIDYIYAKSKKLYPVDSYAIHRFDGKVVTLPKFENGKLKERGVYVFPSDHSAVVTTYEWLD